MTNQELLNKVNETFDKLGVVSIGKEDTGVMTLGDTNFGGLLPRQAVEELLVLVHQKSEWLGKINHVTRIGKSGTVPILKLNTNITEHVGENEARTIGKKTDTSQVPYMCKKYRADWYITVEQIREAIAAGIANYEEKVNDAFSVALANDMGNIVMNSDKTLDDSTSMNRMLNATDGVDIISEKGNVFDAEGKAFGKGIFTAMEDAMPDEYANDPNLHWMYTRRVDTHYKSELQALLTNLGDQALTHVIQENPNGIPPVIVPQIKSNKGPDAIAPTSASDQTTYIELVLTTLVTAGHVADVASGVGRKFKVTCKATGYSENCVGYEDTTLRIKTTGLLGQETVSTDASDYEVCLCDETDIYYNNPKAITKVDCYDMLSYRIFEPEFPRWKVITFYWMDVLIPNPDAFVKFKRVAITPKVTW